MKNMISIVHCIEFKKEVIQSDIHYILKSKFQEKTHSIKGCCKKN